MSQHSEVKERMEVYISNSLLKEFKELIKEKSSDGVYDLSHEVEKAIRSYLSGDKNNNDNKKEKKFFYNKIWMVKREVKEFLANEYRISIDEVGIVSFQDLKRAIRSTKGTDDRTVKKYITLLKEENCVIIVNDKHVDIS